MALNVQNTTLRISAGLERQFPADPIAQVAFSGRSNVGKSSLINTLLGRKSMARVSSSPGKTITINFYDVDHKLFLVDLPGYGFAKRSAQSQQVFSSLTDGYFTRNRNIDRLALVVQLLDSRIGPTADDEMMLRFLGQSSLPFVIVATKTDKLNRTEYKQSLESLHANPLMKDARAILPFSSLRGEGKNELWRQILLHTGLSF